MIEREIGLLQKIVGMCAVLRRQCDTDTGADADIVLADRERLGDERDDPGGERLGGVGLLGIVELDDGEFVAAEPRQHVGFAERVLDPLGHLLEQFVAGRVPERVVDLLEAVEIHHEDVELLAAPAVARAGVFDLFDQRRAIGEARERVMMREIGDARLGTPTLGDVLVRRQPAAVRHRMPQDHDDAAVAELLDVGRSAELGGDIFGRVCADEIAADFAVVDDRFELRARLHHVFRQIVDLPVALVGDQNPMLRVEHAQALRHVLQRRGKPGVGFLQRVSAFHQGALDILLLGDVVVDGDPAAVGHRLVIDEDDAAVASARSARRTRHCSDT